MMCRRRKPSLSMDISPSKTNSGLYGMRGLKLRVTGETKQPPVTSAGLWVTQALRGFKVAKNDGLQFNSNLLP
jgi:hypothetical protein